jgi:hypothetical protein
MCLHDLAELLDIDRPIPVRVSLLDHTLDLGDADVVGEAGVEDAVKLACVDVAITVEIELLEQLGKAGTVLVPEEGMELCLDLLQVLWLERWM